MSGFPAFLHLLAPRLRPGTRHHRPRLTEPWTKPRHRDDDLQTLHYLSGILRCHYGKIWHNFVYSLPKKYIYHSIIDFFHFLNFTTSWSRFLISRKLYILLWYAMRWITIGRKKCKESQCWRIHQWNRTDIKWKLIQYKTISNHVSIFNETQYTYESNLDVNLKKIIICELKSIIFNATQLESWANI